MWAAAGLRRRSHLRWRAAEEALQRDEEETAAAEGPPLFVVVHRRLVDTLPTALPLSVKYFKFKLFRIKSFIILITLIFIHHFFILISFITFHSFFN
jgi:hypothetical protein